MKTYYLLYIIIITVLFSCSDRYKLYSSRYTFKSSTGLPDYSDLDYWAAHPWKKDPSDSIPRPLANQQRDSVADVFFLHPTSFTRRLKKKSYNAAIDNSYLNAKTDYSTLLYQASVFNQHARIFAPRYRQAHLKVFLKTDKEIAEQALELAYQDVKTSFEFYLRHWHKGRPIIIAAHSQGSLLAERLLKEFFEGTSLKEKLVVAYLAGWPLPRDYFSDLGVCADSLQTGCACSWRTLKKGFIPYYFKNEKGSSYATNPLTWVITEEYAPRDLNKGSLLFKFNKIYPKTTDAKVHEGFLWVRKPKFPWSFLYFRRNYHIGDINLYYINIRENVEQRIQSYLKTRQTLVSAEKQ